MSDPSAKKQYNKFWWISLGVHAAILLTLFLTPARQIFFPEKEPPKRPDVTLRDRKLEEVVNKIRESEAAALAQRVALLEAGAERMGTNRGTFQNRFDQFNQVRLENAKSELRGSMDATLKISDELREASEKAFEKPDQEQPVAEFVLLTGKNSARLLDQQEAIRRGLLLLEMNEDLYSRQKEVDERQLSADQQMLWLRQQHERVVNARETIEEVEKQAKDLREELEDYRKDVEEKRQLVERVDKKIAELEEKVKDENRLQNRAKHAEERANNAMREANEKARQAGRNDDKDREQKLKAEAQERRKDRDKARREGRQHGEKAKQLQEQIRDLKDSRYNEARREVNASKRKIREMENSLSRMEEQLTNTRKNLENALQERKAKVEISQNILTAAFYQQRDLVEEIRQALEGKTLDSTTEPRAAADDSDQTETKNQ